MNDIVLACSKVSEVEIGENQVFNEIHDYDDPLGIVDMDLPLKE